MMIKQFSPAGWDMGSPVASMVKLASDGLRGNDRREFIKRASGSENVFLPYLDSVKMASGEVPLHLIAYGGYEKWGANRNGDAAMRNVLKAAHDTFVSHARFFRNHKNRPHEGHPHYGSVKLAAYNPTMDRVELLVGLFGTKEAADAGGGLLADNELHKLANDNLAVSMAMRVPYDECSACHNKARTRSEYCKEASCPAGGCDKNLTKLVKLGRDAHHLHVQNHDPVFFDISHVYRPADRTAYGNVADYLVKAADDNGFIGIGGAQAAEDLGLVAPLHVILAQSDVSWNTKTAEQVKLAHGLDVLERAKPIRPGDEALRAFDPALQSPLDFSKLGLDPASPATMAAGLGALADQGIVIPLREFARMTKRADLATAAAGRLPGIYGRMLADGSLEGRVSRNPYAVSEKLASVAQRNAAFAAADDYALTKSAASGRIVRSAISGQVVPVVKTGFDKSAADNPAAENLAREYAVYQLSALRRIAEFDTAFPLTARMAACQNAI